MHIHKLSNHFPVKLLGNDITPSDSVCNLGVIFYTDFTFHKHISITGFQFYRIQFKLSTLTYRALAIHQPPYLASLLHFSNIPRQLRSSTSQQLSNSIPRTKLNLGKGAFSVAAPIIWNELPTTLKSCESLASFRKNLKTYLFKIAFPPLVGGPSY